MANQKYRVQPPVGLSVQWYPGGDMTKPVPAIMQKIDGQGEGMALVTTIPAGLKGVVDRPFVLYCEDPEVKRKPPSWIQQYGTWGYIPGTQKAGLITPQDWGMHKKLRDDELARMDKQNQQAAKTTSAK